MSKKHEISAEEALKKLKAGNERYLETEAHGGDFSSKIREKTAAEGQFPYAAIVACADSRVMPEVIFNAGIGELFVIRTAGNAVSGHQLGSLLYACEHLGCRLAVVMGHDFCGAIEAALGGKQSGPVGEITDEICENIGDEKDPLKASILNVMAGVEKAEKALSGIEGVKTVGAIYHIREGRVEFLEG